MQCTNCGYDNRQGSKYCNQCGLPLINGITTNDQISLGGYDYSSHPHIKNVNGKEFMEKKESQMNSFGQDASVTSRDEDIVDRENLKKKKKKRGSSLLKMILLFILIIFVFVGFNGIRYAMNAQEQRVTQAELAKKQQAEAEELQRLESYREKFNAVILNYELQGELISENIDKISALRINRFAKNLGLGNLFNKAVNTIFDVSQVNDLKMSSQTLNVLVDELINPPETFATKYKSLQDLQNLENNITEKMQGDLTSDTKKELSKLHEEFKTLVTNIKR